MVPCCSIFSQILTSSGCFVVLQPANQKSVIREVIVFVIFYVYIVMFKLRRYNVKV